MCKYGRDMTGSSRYRCENNTMYVQFYSIMGMKNFCFKRHEFERYFRFWNKNLTSVLSGIFPLLYRCSSMLIFVFNTPKCYNYLSRRAWAGGRSSHVHEPNGVMSAKPLSCSGERSKAVLSSCSGSRGRVQGVPPRQ